MHLALNLLGYSPPARPWQEDYCAGVVPELLHHPLVHEATLLVTPLGLTHWRRQGREDVHLQVVEGLDERKRRRFYAERYLLPRILRELRADAVFAPLGGSLLGTGIPYAYRLPSLDYVEQPEEFSPLEQLFYGKTIPASCRIADVVLVDHEPQARIAARRGIALREKLKVVLPGLSLPGASGGLPAGLTAERYVLIPGGDGRPALASLLDRLLTHTRLPRDWENVIFVHCSRKGPDAGDLQASSRLLAIDNAPSGMYAELLRGCAVCMCLDPTSTGTTPLRQALAAGRPVIAADTPVFRSIAGDAADYVPAYGLADTASALAVLLGDARARTELSERAAASVRVTTWENTAHAVIAVLSSAYERSSVRSAG